MSADGGVYYHEYLDLDRLLSAQHPRSVAAGSEAHDEMLFIIVHQAYELWFKLILHELHAVLDTFELGPVRERQMGTLVARLERITSIQRVLMDQLDVMETMTPLDFLDFRDLLIPASGFQSLQFRLIENLLGLDPEERVLINEARYTSRFTAKHRRVLEASEREHTLHELVEAWLERTPFLEMGDYAFWDEYRAAVDRTLDAERTAIEANPDLSEEGRREQLARHASVVAGFAPLFDDDAYRELQRAGLRRMSRRAFMAALLISLYRDEPILQLPFRLIMGLIDIDEGFTAWRHRHAQMVLRMIGLRIGTGGTSGHDYLSETTRRSRVWTDLVALPTYLIPRSELPDLPPTVVEAMRFHVGESPER
jgi:tryptophan 2,3-dioxygenase